MYTLQAFKSDTLASDITDSADSLTLSLGSFGTPAGEQLLVIDPDVAAKREIIKCEIDGASVTNITRGVDGTAAVSHSSGAQAIMAFVPAHYEALKDDIGLADEAIATGWLSANEAWTYASATSFTVSGDVTNRYAVGDKLRLKQGGDWKYFYVASVAYSSPNTTITVAGDKDHPLTNAPITDNYYSKGSTPVGFPDKLLTDKGYLAYAPRVEDVANSDSWNKFSRYFDVAGTRFLVGRQFVTNWTNDAVKTINFHSVPGVPNPCFGSGEVVVIPCLSRGNSHGTFLSGNSDGSFATATGFTVKKRNLDYAGGDDALSVEYFAIGPKP